MLPITSSVSFSSDEASSVVIAMQNYAIEMEQKNLFATAAMYYDMAARACLACGWDKQALVCKNNAHDCRHQSAKAA